MSERTALEAIQALDKDRMAVKITVNQIMDLLHDFIPRACLREAEDRLYEAFFVNGVKLTSNTMREADEAWKKLEIGTFLGTSPVVKP